MNLTHYVTAQKKQISGYLVDYLSEKKRFFAHDPFTLDALTRLETYAQQGKMLRGVLVMLSYELFSKEAASEDALRAAVAIELTQSGALMHDDIMDGDTLRRGQTTIHTQYSLDMPEAMDPKLYGEAMGICLGDMSFFMAFELVGKINNVHVSQVFSTHMQRCISGQIADVTLGQSVRSGEKEEILGIYLNKTGYYSVVLPLLLGAHLAKAEEKFVHSLIEIGKGIGIIFQIKDDELGLLGDEKEIGKVQGSDIRENKKTLLRYLLFVKVRESERKKLETIFGNKELSADDITYVKTLYKSHAIENDVTEIIAEFSSDIEKHLFLLPQNNNAALLREFYEYNLTRRI